MPIDLLARMSNLAAIDAADFQTLLASIPVAHDGQIITSEDWNKMRVALLQLAEQGDGVPAGRIVTQTVTPVFAPDGTDQPWVQLRGLVSKVTPASTAHGWMEVRLPDGVQLQSMTVVGDKQGNVPSFRVRFEQIPFDDPGKSDTLLNISLSDNSDNFTVTKDLAERTVIDNSANKYLLYAQILSADNDASARLFSFQFTYRR